MVEVQPKIVIVGGGQQEAKELAELVGDRYEIVHQPDDQSLHSVLRALGEGICILDPQGRMALDWGLYGVPETYVIDGDGNIILRFAGPVTQRVIESDIRPALAKAAGQ